jgi:hypothetical protein
MARQDTLSIKLEDGVTAAELAEGYGPVIENVYSRAISNFLKATNFSGDPSTGSVEFKRFETALSQAYGTARAAGAGDDVQSKPVVVNIDNDKEIVEEVEIKDVKLYGVADILGRRQRELTLSMVKELDTAFFTEAYQEGTVTSTSSSDINDKLEDLIVATETTYNSFIDGLDRDMLALVVSPATHSAIRKLVDDLPTQDNFFARGAVGMFHGVPLYVSHHLPKESGKAVTAFCLMPGAIAQPVTIDGYGAERIPLSNAMALELFYSFGVQAIVPEAIRYLGDAYSAS